MLVHPDNAILSLRLSVNTRYKSGRIGKGNEKEKKGKQKGKEMRLSHFLNKPDYVFKNYILKI